MKAGKTDVIIQIPNNFEKGLVKDNKAQLQIIIDAINGSAAGLTFAYTASIISDFNKDLITEWFNFDPKAKTNSLNISTLHWYNPELNYKTFMVPGILVLLVTIVGFFLSGMNVVREKEIGTIEQLNVTPIKKYQFIAGKLIPFWVISMFELSFGLVLGKLIFKIPIEGNVGLVFGVASVYLLVILGMALFVATVTNTQQQSMFVSWFLLILFILMSGLFTAIENMPKWAQYLDYLNPVAYFIRAIRMILLKGSTFWDIRKEFFALVIYGITVLMLASWRYKKVS
jgi:ABC-2 type transport system permease protein